MNERKTPYSTRITVSSRLRFTVFSGGDDRVAQRLWGRLALNRHITSEDETPESIRIEPDCVELVND